MIHLARVHSYFPVINNPFLRLNRINLWDFL